MDLLNFFESHIPNWKRFRPPYDWNPEQYDCTVKFEDVFGKKRFFASPKDEGGQITFRYFDVSQVAKVECVGTYNWNFVEKTTQRVGLDIDTLVGHKAGLDPESFKGVLDSLSTIPFVEVRWSSGGTGAHVYVYFTEPVGVSSRQEMQRLGKATAALVGRMAGFDPADAVDKAGGNLWFCKPECPENAYKIIKPAECPLDPSELPPGWRDVEKSTRSKVQFTPSSVKLTSAHLKVLSDVEKLNYAMKYLPDLELYHVHTAALKEAYLANGYHGYFDTNSLGSDPGTPNAYAIPLHPRGLLIKRFGDAAEGPSWFQGPNGAYTYLDVPIAYDRAVELFCLNSTTKGYAFDRDSLSKLLAAIDVGLLIPEEFQGRDIFLKTANNKANAQIIVPLEKGDPTIDGWTDTGKQWQRSFAIPATPKAYDEADSIRSSEVVRAVANSTESTNWCVLADNDWVATSSGEVRNVLSNYVMNPSCAMGRLRQEPYWIVHRPFQPEYLPGRQWNQGAPQYACQPAESAGDTPTWDAMFAHIGKDINDDVANDECCRSVGIRNGAEYLMSWVSLLLQKPEQRLPYLFLTSKENNTGKTTFGKAMHLLINPGVDEINEEAITDKFNGELEGKILCLIEELDLRGSGNNRAYATIKRLTTSPTLSVRKMRTDTYNIPNYTHFIHTANDANFVPCDSEDIRIVMIPVSPIEQFIESHVLDSRLQEEAPSMLRKLLDMEMPPQQGRFWLPVVQTSLKEAVIAGAYEGEVTDAEESVREFARTHLVASSKGSVPTSEAWTHYIDFCEAERLPKVPKPAFLKNLRGAGLSVERKQKRTGESRAWHYSGITFREPNSLKESPTQLPLDDTQTCSKALSV